jgi:acyl-CoA thioester hydrolase
MPRNDFSGCLTASIPVRVPFFDVDAAGVTWHGRYFQYFEIARAALLEQLDYSYDEMIDSGILWPVTDTNVRYLRPLLLNQDVTVTACLREWEMRIVVDYRIEDEDGTLFTRARTVQVPIDAETHEMTFGSPDFFVENVLAKQREAGLTGE